MIISNEKCDSGNEIFCFAYTCTLFFNAIKSKSQSGGWLKMVEYICAVTAILTSAQPQGYAVFAIRTFGDRRGLPDVSVAPRPPA